MQAGREKRGVLYIAFGTTFRAEAARSIDSVRRRSPGIPVAVVTDRDWDLDPGPDILVKRNWDVSDRVGSHGCKPEFLYEASPFEQTIFLDTDTVVVDEISGIFGLLEYFDLGVRFYGRMLREQPFLEYMPRCQTGVLLFRRNERLATFFADYRATFTNRLAEARETLSDQVLPEERSFTVALARSKVRVVHLEPHMNLHTGEALGLHNRPGIFHTRLDGVVSRTVDLERRSGATWNQDRRLWLPCVEGFLPIGIRDALREGDVLLALAYFVRRWRNRRRYRRRQ